MFTILIILAVLAVVWAIAISREETLRRGTMLAGRIRELQGEKER